MKNKKYILLLASSLLVIIILGVTYAWLIQTVNSNKIQAMRVGTFKLSLEEGNSLSLPSSEFMSDEDGLKQDGFTFSVANTGKFTGSYSVYLDDDSINSDQTRLDDKYIKYNLEVNGTKGNSVALNNRKIYEGTLTKGKTDNFVLRIWLNKDVNGDIGGQVFKVKLRIEVNQEITPTPVAEKLLAGVGSNGSIDTNLSVNYSTDITIGSFLNNAFLTSLKFISSDQVKMIEDSTTWYLGTISANDNPNNIKNSNDKISLKIGMLRLGELMACQKSYSLPENPSFRLLTPYSTTEIRDIGGSGDSYYDSPSIQRGIRPAMNLKSNVVITGGDGTKSNPFTIALN